LIRGVSKLAKTVVEGRGLAGVVRRSEALVEPLLADVEVDLCALLLDACVDLVALDVRVTAASALAGRIEEVVLAEPLARPPERPPA
jgi:hypothetical protein